MVFDNLEQYIALEAVSWNIVPKSNAGVQPRVFGQPASGGSAAGEAPAMTAEEQKRFDKLNEMAQG